MKTKDNINLWDWKNWKVFDTLNATMAYQWFGSKPYHPLYSNHDKDKLYPLEIIVFYKHKLYRLPNNPNTFTLIYPEIPIPNSLVEDTLLSNQRFLHRFPQLVCNLKIDETMCYRGIIYTWVLSQWLKYKVKHELKKQLKNVK